MVFHIAGRYPRWNSFQIKDHEPENKPQNKHQGGIGHTLTDARDVRVKLPTDGSSRWLITEKLPYFLKHDQCAYHRPQGNNSDGAADSGDRVLLVEGCTLKHAPEYLAGAWHIVGFSQCNSPLAWYSVLTKREYTGLPCITYTILVETCSRDRRGVVAALATSGFEAARFFVPQNDSWDVPRTALGRLVKDVRLLRRWKLLAMTAVGAVAAQIVLSLERYRRMTSRLESLGCVGWEAAWAGGCMGRRLRG